MNNKAALVSPNAILDHFNEQGFYLAKGVFSHDEIDELEVEFDRIVTQLQSSGEEINARWQGAAVERLQASDTVVLHTHNVQCFSAKWLAALLHPGFLEIASALLGPDVILHHTKLFQKPGERGAPFPMHQDWGYFPTRKDTMLAGVIHVSHATDAMGCFRLYPGSHRLGRMGGTMGGGQEEESRILRENYPIEGSTPVEAEPGDVLFFHYFLIHGSLPNRSSETRKTVLVQMHAGHDQVEEQVRHPNSRLALTGWNYGVGRKTAGCAD